MKCPILLGQGYLQQRDGHKLFEYNKGALAQHDLALQGLNISFLSNYFHPILRQKARLLLVFRSLVFQPIPMLLELTGLIPNECPSILQHRQASGYVYH